MAGELRFGKDRRVRKRSEFAHVQSTSRRVTTPHFVLLVAAQRPRRSRRAANGRPAAAAPRAHRDPEDRGAVVRNRIKRVCKECFRLWPGLVPDGIDLVVVARQGAQELGLKDVRAEWGTVSGLLRRRAEEALARSATATHLSRQPRRP